MHPTLTGKSTGTLLEINNSELHVLKSVESLCSKADEAVAVVGVHQEAAPKQSAVPLVFQLFKVDQEPRKGIRASPKRNS